jgi:hypothetical protein
VAPAAPELPERRPIASDSEPAVRDYRSGGYEVRDHRTGSGDERPRDVPPNVHPPGARELPSGLVHAITQPVRNAVKGCSSPATGDLRGAKPRIEGLVTVSIKNHQLTIADTAMEVRDVTNDAAAGSIRECVAREVKGASVPARDQDDLDSYTINIAFALP